MSTQHTAAKSPPAAPGVKRDKKVDELLAFARERGFSEQEAQAALGMLRGPPEAAMADTLATEVHWSQPGGLESLAHEEQLADWVLEHLGSWQPQSPTPSPSPP